MSPPSANKLAARLTSIARVKNLFLKGILAAYLATFVSLYVQVRSLFGDQGIVPVRDYVNRLQASSKENHGPLYSFNLVVQLAPLLKLDYGTFIELLCIFAALIAIVGLFTRRVSTTFSFALLWYIFYSICQIGQGFMTFHSDLLLLELGFLAILIASILPKSKSYQASHDFLSLFLVRWLVFRVFFTSALSSFLDVQPNESSPWYDLNYLKFSMQSASFPSPLAWHMHNLPDAYLKFIQATFASLTLTTPFLFFVPLKYVRLFAFWTMFFITGFQALAFSFGVYHILLIVGLLAVLRDNYAFEDRKAKFSTLKTVLDFFVLSAFVCAVMYGTKHFYGIKYTASTGQLFVKTQFTPAQFETNVVKYLVPASIGVAVLSFVGNFYKTFKGPHAKTPYLKSFIYSCVCLVIFMASLSTVSRYDPATERVLAPVTRDAQAIVSPLKIINNYASFYKLPAGAANGRSELILQGRVSADQQVWDLYDTRFKPGYRERSLAFIVPHLPRLDAKLIQATRSNVAKNPWIHTLMYRIAERQKDVLKSLSPTAPLNKPSKQLRVALYSYKFSTKSSMADSHWSQTKFVSEYMPLTTPENLKFVVKSNGINLASSPVSDSGSVYSDLLKTYLDFVSDYLSNIDQLLIVWSIFVGSSIISIIRT